MRHLVALSITMLLCASVPAGAQSDREGALVGTVRDASGAVLVGAVVQASSAMSGG